MKKYSKDIGYARILRNIPIGNSTEKILSKGLDINKKLFKKPLKRKFDIILCDTNEEYKKAAKYYYTPNGTATVLRDDTLVTKSPELIEKIGKFSKKDFGPIMVHEMNHVFWNQFYKTLTKPCWLLEGLACYVGNTDRINEKELRKIIQEHKIDHKILEYRYLARNFAKGHFPQYEIWGAFTEYLANKKSDKDLVKLMDLYIKNPIKEHYLRTFKNIFGKTEKKMFKEFLNQLFNRNLNKTVYGHTNYKTD